MLHTGLHYFLLIQRQAGPLWILFIAGIFACKAQEPTRAEQIERQQQEKAKELKPEAPGKVERSLFRRRTSSVGSRRESTVSASRLAGWSADRGSLAVHSIPVPICSTITSFSACWDRF